MGIGDTGSNNSEYDKENNANVKFLKNSVVNKKLRKPIYGLTLASILLFASLIAWPEQMAMGHESAWHDFCWDQTLNAFDFLPDLIPPLFPWLKAAAVILAVLLGIVLSLACNPQIVPPTDRNILLECNTNSVNGEPKAGFIAFNGNAGKNTGAQKITADDLSLTNPKPGIPTVGQFKSDAFVTDDSGNQARVGFGIIHFVESVVPLLLILGPTLIEKAFGGLSFIAGLLLGAIFGFFDYKFFMTTVHAPNDGHAAHPVARVKEVTVSNQPTAFYKLGDNQITYSMVSTVGSRDSTPYRFNVVDVDDPQLEFQHNPVRLEANAHFGFDVDSISISELGIITGVDVCDPFPKVTYHGQSYYPLTIIEPEQLATWRVTEHTYEAWEENSDASFIEELKDFSVGTSLSITSDVYGNLVGKRLDKQIQEIKIQIDSAKIAREFGPEQIKVLDGNIADQKLKLEKLENKLLIANGIKKNSPIANVDVEIDRFKKSIAAEKLKLSNLELDLDKTTTKVSSADIDVKTLRKTLGGLEVKKLALGKFAGGALGALGAFYSEFSKSTPQRITEGGLFTERNQTIIVEDTIAPDILVLRNLAVEVDNPGDTVELEILPPLLFDVADPFPTLTTNATGTFEELEGDTLTVDFNLGLTKIAWNATDFSGNQSPLVIQLVNIKETGTNIQSVAFNQTIPNAFTDVPLDIVLNATNPDRDPIEFIIEENPEEGIIESPIEAIFQNKFQLQGTISRLKGLTVDPTTEEIRLTDSENDRVMKLDSMGALDVAFSTSGITDRPEGIDRIDSNNFLLSEWENEKIMQVNTSTGVTQLTKTFDVSGLFEEPQNIAVQGDNIFVTDSFNRTVTRIDNTDAFLAPRTLGTPNDIVSDGNSLFVVDSGNSRIINFDSSVFDFQFGNLGTSDGQFDLPLGITKNSTHLVIADTNNDRLQLFELNGNFVAKVGTSGSANDQFLSPSDVALNSTHILVADRDNHRIQIFNSSASYQTTIGTGVAGTANDQLSSPSGLALNATHIFVADTSNHRIQIFNNTGLHVQTIGAVGTPSITNGEFDGPQGVAVNGTHIFVADTNNNRIQIFNSSGIFSSKFGSPGSGDNEFDNPTRVRLDASNNIYVADSGNNRIQKFDSGGNFVQTLDSKVVSGFDDYITRFQLSFNDLQADSVDINSDDEIFVADWNQERIVKLVRDASQIPQIDVSTFGLTDPKNIAINSTKDIFITDRANQKILTLDNDGTFKGEIDLSAIPLDPYGIAIDGNDNIFVSDWQPGSEKIVQVDEQGNQLGPSFDLQTVFSNPQDIAVNGTFFWITDDKDSGKKIVQIRNDKGKIAQFDLISTASNRLGLSFVDQSDFGTILFTNSTDGFVYQLDLLSGKTSILKELIGEEPHGITSTPMLPRFLGQFVINATGGLDRPTGLIFGPDLNLYVASTGDDSIKRFNGITGIYIDDFVKPESGDLSYPRDMLFGIDGNLYVSSFDTDSIKRYNGTTGEYIDDFVKPNKGGLDGPVGLTFDLTSNLLVSNSLNHNIIQFNGSSGKFIKFFVNNTASEGLQSPQTMSFGPDGNLYVTSKDSNEILRYNGLTGASLGNFTNSDRLNEPVTLAFDFLNDLLYVSSKGDISDEILQYNATTGRFIGVLTTGELERPAGMTLDLTGLVYSTSFNNNEVLRYGVSPVSMFVSDWTSTVKDRLIGLNSTGDKVFGFDFDISIHVDDPRYIASDSLGNIWVADVQAGNGILVNFDGGIGTFERIINLTDIPTENEDSMVMLALSDDGSMASLDDDGNLVLNATIPKTSVIPEGIALDSTDSFYVSDWDNHRIVKLTPQGTFVEQFKINSTFTDPKDLVVIDEEGFVRLFVSDGATGEIIELRSDRLLSELELEEISSSVNGLTRKDDSLFLTSTDIGTNGKLFERDSKGFVSEITDVFIEPYGIAVTAPDKIYVTDWKDERIIKLDDMGSKTDIFDLSFARFLELNKLRDIDVKEEIGSVNFWVSDSRRAEIPKIVFATQTIASQPSVADKFVFMSSLAVDSTDDFYVTSTQNSTFVKFSERGSLKNNVTIAETRALIDVSTGHNSTDNTDLVYLAIGNPAQIIKYNSTLNEINSTSFDQRATSVAVDSVGNIFVSFTNDTITQFSNDFSVKQPLVIPGGGTSVSDMVIDAVDNLFASDSALHRIHKFNLTSGDYLGWLGKCDTDVGCDLNDNHTKGFSLTASSIGTKNGGDFSQFFEPSDITVDRTGNLYVADIQKKDDLNSPRIQKFSNTGFFIENFLSNSSNTRIKGNFNNTQAIAVGSNFFYVADIEKLHFFDINPFSEVTTNLLTNITSSMITYQANSGFPVQPLPPAFPIEIGFDNFKFKVSDGFVDSNIALVNITVSSPDIDRDGIFFNVDPLPIVNSTTFADSENKTTGTITDYGDQVLTIRDSRESDKGVFIQADVTPTVAVNPKSAIISACNDVVQMELNPGNRLQLTCGSGQVDVIRGNISFLFFDTEGRNATATIGVGDGLHFTPFNFAFTAPETNSETIDVLVKFNTKEKTYMVPSGEEVIVDTEVPTINQGVCSVPITLEAEIIFGVNATTTTGHLPDINKFLNLVVLDVDNGFPQMTEGMEILTTHNATKNGKTQFSLNSTKILFTAVDDIGNTATCTSTVTVEDTTRPTIKPDIDIIVVETPLHDDVAAVNFKTGTTFDLPIKFGDAEFDLGRVLIDRVNQPQCIPPSGSVFVIGDNAVGCVATDKEGNVGNTDFTITVTKNPTDLFIESITASDESLPVDYSDGDTITVLFSQDTNRPPIISKSEIDALFKFTENDNSTAVSIGQNYVGNYVNAKMLVITISDSTGGNLTTGDTRFAIQPGSKLTSAAGSFSASTTPSPQLSGDFISIAAPIITAFLADDPKTADFDDGDDMLDDIEISVDDVIILRFDKSTNTPGGLGLLDKNKVDNLFRFVDSSGNPIVPGADYEGRWINALTFQITILELNVNVAFDPVIGDTIAMVKLSANLKDVDEKSVVSASKSKPLAGSFAPFNVQKSVEPNGTATTVLPSGLTIGITFPDGSDKVTISKSMATTGSFKFLGHTIEINSATDNSCDNGCTVSFTFTQDDLKSKIFSLNKLRILHDEDGDGEFQKSERLIPTITPDSPPGPFTANVTVFSLSDFGIGEEITPSGGGGGDRTSPRFTTQSITGSGVLVTCPDDPSALCQGAIIQEVIRLTNSMPTAKIETGKNVRLSMLLYEKSGIEGLDHISLYMNLRGFERSIHESDTFIRLHQGEQTITDPNGYFQSAEVSLIPRGIYIEAVFDITFAKSMELSDIIFRAWDHKLNSRDAKFLTAIEVVEPQNDISTNALTILSGEEGLGDSQELIIEKEILNKWAGFSEETISDSDLLAMVGLEGNKIPIWYKDMIAQWMIKNEVVSEHEFLNALTFFYNNDLLEP